MKKLLCRPNHLRKPNFNLIRFLTDFHLTGGAKEIFFEKDFEILFALVINIILFEATWFRLSFRQ